MKIVSVWQTVLANEKRKTIIEGIAMGIMLILIVIKLFNTDFSTAPEYIYSQF